MNDLEKVIDGIDLGLPAPFEEPERQYYFIKKGREYVTARSKELGRDLFHTDIWLSDECPGF